MCFHCLEPAQLTVRLPLHAEQAQSVRKYLTLARHTPNILFDKGTLSLTIVGATSGNNVTSSTRKKFLKRAAQYSQQIASGTPTRKRKRNRHLVIENNTLSGKRREDQGRGVPRNP